MDKVCIYLRKSRVDIELERKETIDTLERHKKVLLEYADRNEIEVTKIFSEVVSGETISARPEMQKLLSEIEACLWDAVLVMEVERLARGDTIDQGIVARYFKFSETKIITPTKIYDPNNEFDEEYFEFGLFMSRREYKTINRRLQNGRLLSVKEGKFIGSIAPYGYKKKKLVSQKGYTLEIIEEEAEIVKYIFNLCLKGKGSTKIADELNKIGIHAKIKTYWTANTVRDMLKNPVYIGKIRWNYRKTNRNTVNGEIKKTRPLNKDYLLIDAIHEQIINIKTFNKVQKILDSKRIKQVPRSKELQNPFAGLIICGKCNKKMIRKPDKNGNHLLFCTTKDCGNISALLSSVESKLEKIIIKRIDEQKILFDYKVNNQNSEIELLEKELTKLQNTLLKVYDFYESSIYDEKIFLQRKNKIEGNIVNIIDKLNEQKNNHSFDTNIPKISKFICNQNNENKLKLYSKIIDKIIYTKEKGGHHFKDAFLLKVFLNL